MIWFCELGKQTKIKLKKYRENILSFTISLIKILFKNYWWGKVRRVYWDSRCLQDSESTAFKGSVLL